MAQDPCAAEHPCRKLPPCTPKSHPHAAFPDLPIRGIVNNLQSLFESFLRSQPRSAGVSRLALLWKSWPGKPDGGPADPVYRFGRLFELGEAKLYGEDVKMSWDHPSAQPPQPHKKGTVFLNWRGPAEDRAAGGDPIADKGGDPAASEAGDPIASGHSDQITSKTQEMKERP